MKTKWRVFINEYFRDWNGAAAARRAGYIGRPDVIAARLLANVSIKAEIERRVAERAMSADEVLDRLGQMARGDLGDAIRSHPAGQQSLSMVDWQKLVDAGKTYLVRKFKVTKEGVEIELHDPQRALELLGKHHKLFTERTETFNIDVSKLSDDQLERIAAGEDVFRVLATPGAGGTGTAPAGKDETGQSLAG